MTKGLSGVLVGSLGLTAAWSCGGTSPPPSLDPGDGGPGTFGRNDSSTGSSSGSGAGSSSGAGPGFGAGSSSGAGSGSGPVGVAATCIVGTRGCLCDSTGGCGSGLTCSPQPSPDPSLCCSGSNCTSSATGVAGTCGKATGAATCKPGVTVLATRGSNDGCGYPASDFNESQVLCGINAVGGGDKPGIIQVFYNDEHALTLGCDTPTYPVSALPTSPSSIQYPTTGDPACVDTFNRPLRPVLFITDITVDATCTAGDMQKGGHAYDPIAVFGTWKSATEGTSRQGTPNRADPTANGGSLGSGADALPAACQQGGGGGFPFPGFGGGQFVSELKFEVGLVSGHSYRVQVLLHDGDQTRGGDSGEACVTFCAGSGAPQCPPGAAACGSDGSCGAGLYCTEFGCCEPPGTDTDAGTVIPK